MAIACLCLIAAAAPPPEGERFASSLVDTLNVAIQASGLTATAWITQLQVELSRTDIELYFWLFGSQGVIEVLPGKTLFSGDRSEQKTEDIRPLAKVPNTPPPTPPRLPGGETKRSFGGVGFFLLFDLCKRSKVCYK